MTSAARHTAMKNIADDGGLQALQRLLMLQDRERIEQSLRRMLVHAVSRVNDGDVEMLCHQVRRASRWMPHNDAIGAHGPQRVSRIEYGFAFLNAGSR